MSTYRINYGNGQVSESMSKVKAIQSLREQKEYSNRIGQGGYNSYLYLERYEGDGEWVKVSFTEEQENQILYRTRHGKC